MTTFKNAIDELIYSRMNPYYNCSGRRKHVLFFVSREEWEGRFLIMIPNVPSNPMRMIHTYTLQDVDYIPSVSDMIAKDWVIVRNKQ